MFWFWKRVAIAAGALVLGSLGLTFGWVVMSIHREVRQGDCQHCACLVELP